MTDSRAWYNRLAKDFPAAATFEVICPIVRLKTEEGGTWTGLPSFLGPERFGWSSEADAVVILDPYALHRFEIGRDPDDFEVLLRKEADEVDRRFLDEADARAARGDLAGAAGARLIAASTILARVTKRIRLVTTHTFREPDPAQDLVLVHTRSPSVIDEATDRGIIIPRAGAGPRDRVRLSLRDRLGDPR